VRPLLLDLLATYHAGRRDFRFSRLPDGLVRWALECGLAPVLARCCAEDPEAAASPHWPTVQGSDLAARVTAADQEQATLELIEACRPRTGALTLLKGVWAAHALHPAPHLRPMRDVDVLVERAQAQDVAAVLLELGYAPVVEDGEGEFGHHNHLVPYQHPATGVVVEVHHALVPIEGPPGSDPLAMARVREHLRPATYHGQAVNRLSNELQVAYLAAHWAGSLDVVGGGGGLVIMMDLPALARDVDWRSVVDLLSSPSAASATLLILWYLETRGLLELEPWILPAVWQRQRAFGRANLGVLCRLIDRHLVEGRPYEPWLTSRTFDVVWMGLLNSRSPLVNLLSLPWSLLPLAWRIAATPIARPIARLMGIELRELDQGAERG
jgi:hypothetical protein